MGLSGVSPVSLLLILVIILVLFGAKRLRTMGSDLGVALKNFRSAMNDKSEPSDDKKDERLQ